MKRRKVLGQQIRPILLSRQICEGLDNKSWFLWWEISQRFWKWCFGQNIIPNNPINTQIGDNSYSFKGMFLTIIYFFSISSIKSGFSIRAIIMAKIENLDFLDEILKSQQKLRKHTPQNNVIFFNLCVMYLYLDWYFAQNSNLKIFDFFPIAKTMSYH